MTIWLVIYQNLIPEFITTVMMICGGIGSNPALICSYSIVCTFLLRVIWHISILIHGLGHVLSIVIIDRDPSFINTTNILEHRTLSAIFRSLIPFAPIFVPSIENSDYPWVDVGRSTSTSIRFKALGGILFNGIAVGLVPLANSLIMSIDRHPDEFIVGFVINTFVGANLLVIFSSLSDLVAVVTGEATCFNCGNFGFVGKRLVSDDRSLLPARVIDIFKTMGCETEIRGEQAGGGVVFAQDRADRVVFVGTKVVNRKRQNLTQSLEAAFAPVRNQAMRAGAQAVDAAIVGVWHYRYATSSLPAIVETHWHEWMPARTAAVWRFDRGKWVGDRQTVNHRITHNGDFDAWVLFGDPIENADLGLWLERVLHTPNSTLGDSPKIAGMMDLLITQGMWGASLRLAYQLTVAKSIEEAFGGKSPAKAAPNNAPSELEIGDWAAIAEGIFVRHQEAILLPSAKSMLELSPPQVHQLERDLLAALSQHHSIGTWNDSDRSAFVKTAVDVFFHHNPYQATKLFMSRAKGSFGLVTASTLNPDSLVLSAWGQPIATGFNVRDDYMVYASEPAAVDAVLSDIPRSYRLDLEQKGGEIAWVGVDRITIYSMPADRELLGVELAQRWIPLQGNAYILPPTTNAEDPVEHDIQEIPQVLQSIATSWGDPASFNRQSADYLAELLIAKAKSWDRRQRATIDIKLDRVATDRSVDLLITGVESSLWLGERFAQDLITICPALKVATISANQVLRKLPSDSNRLHLGQNSIVLAISQSGQTFPTLQATHAFEELRRQGSIGEIFVMTGEICSLMGTAIEQYYYPASSFTRRIFINGSGRRTAEPTTVAVAAAQATLTELLLYLAKRLRQSFPGQNGAFEMTLTAANLETLDRIKAEFVDLSVVPIVGTTASGETSNSSVHRQLLRSGRNWALHVTETPLVWGIHALYIAISAGFKVPLVQTIANSMFALAHVPIPGLLLPAIVLADVLIYIFGPWFWTLGLRYFQGRPLLARMGKRTLVIGDVPWVHQLLKVYVSKLFSLSYGIASLDVHGANPQDHMLHHFGHRVVRGSLIFLGIPDGRRDKLHKEYESAVIMTGKQANGVRNINAGAEIIALGHNPAIFVPKGSANAQQGFQDTIVLPSAPIVASDGSILEELRESRFGSFERLLASYVLFWALSKQVASFPLLRYQHWKSQSRTRIMTTAAPVAR
ncbi:hypothetical protein [Chamaesiphon minutus]|uniref:Glutamine amidotransferase type-2 domain-containing protein n=1 Tax=Chamaesiphon minutus (strain ATCC 27169 / PCC 6605) TaxID=1173020 RepID=K9UDM9_CHAP6|nr:hypothetical protein [Chamaesiphon minutus]AFY93222.1 hypothetical protein Cha6605_2136 [Chamaesiphon minutus PCC 6605]